MSQVLIVFGSTEGQTRKIARRVAEIAQALLSRCASPAEPVLYVADLDGRPEAAVESTRQVGPGDDGEADLEAEGEAVIEGHEGEGARVGVGCQDRGSNGRSVRCLPAD